MTTNKIPYPKQLISFTDQISLLKQRGMAFGDEAKALHLLQNISYYRLSGYWYPLLADKVFASWLHCIVYVRNICAHHSRLWNRSLSIRPQMPRSPRNTFIPLPTGGTQQIYFVLSMIIYLLNTVNPNHSLVPRFCELLKRYPSIDVRAMGFPDNWKNENLWKDSF